MGRARRLTRLARRLGLLSAILLTFAAIVSIAGFLLAPDVGLGRKTDSSVRVQEVTHLYPVTMKRVVTPRTVEEIASAVAATPGPVSIGGGRYSMGGQTATPDGLQLDLREFRGIVAFDPTARTIRVRSGTRWREIQEAIDSANLAVKIMQTYNSFTVGGTLSVNAHGRYLGEGPVVRSVRSITLVLADGRIVRATPKLNSELFYGAIGGYGALGVIAEVTLDLAENSKVQREDLTLDVMDYPEYFRSQVRNDTSIVFHNADIYPPALQKARAISYRTSNLPVTTSQRIHGANQSSWSHRVAYRVMGSGRTGLWLRQHVVDPWLLRERPVTWRNYEASYDVSELEPIYEGREAYVLQEYFVPVDSFAVFVHRMRRILEAHRVEVINISIRHALRDPGTLLGWAPTEVFAFVLYYQQSVDPAGRREVARWTRELIDAALLAGGRYYLPYQPVATREQFHQAYPRASELLALKRRVDPTGKFTNVLWDLYGGGRQPSRVTGARMPAVLSGEAQQELDTVVAYGRNQAAAYLTHPEWDLVYGSEAYARWLTQGLPPSQFPYLESVGTFWRSYLRSWQASREAFPGGMGTHVMLWVIGISTAVEYGLKGLYEKTIGYLAELNEPVRGTAEAHYAARVSQEYADLIVQKGWYEFDFAGALSRLWTTVPPTGPGLLRKWERRFALTAEYGLKAIYAKLIGLGSRSAYTADDLQRTIVIAGWSDTVMQRVKASAPSLVVAGQLDRNYTLVSVPRYKPFRDALLVLADHAGALRVAEVSGCEIVTLSGTAPVGWQVPARADVIAAYGVPTRSGQVRALLSVRARDLLDVLAALKTDGRFQTDHIYDY